MFHCVDVLAVFWDHFILIRPVFIFMPYAAHLEKPPCYEKIKQIVLKINLLKDCVHFSVL